MKKETSTVIMNLPLGHHPPGGAPARQRLRAGALVALASLTLWTSQAAQPIITLGEAAKYALVGRYIQLHNADVYGNAAIGAESGHYNLDLQSPGILHGIAYKETAATITTTPANVLGGIVIADAAVGQAFADALNAYNQALTLTVDQTITGDINATTTITATHGGQYVIKITGDIKKPLILNPYPGSVTKFIVILEGTINIGGSDTVGWADATGSKNVLIVVKGTGATMQAKVDNKVYGTMLAPYRGATFHGFAGAMITGSEFVKLQSDAQVNFVGYEPLSYDFGDAPLLAQSGFANSYPTKLDVDGARHTATGPTLGAARDTETDGQPTAGADGDDNAGTPDDEDGVTIPALELGATANLTVNASAGSKLDAWIDWNRNGIWETSERITTAGGTAVVAGNNTVSVLVPGDAQLGTSYARFRLSTAGGLAVTGLAADGEVEDYAVTIQSGIPVDLGDAPTAAQSGFASSYPTTVAQDGARHIATGVLLGSVRDAETNGQPTADADGDDANGGPDDEDGVTFPALTPGQTAVITVHASGAGFLDAWIDWNRNGIWETSERITPSGGAAVNSGSNELNVPVPLNASAGTSYARFRIGSTGGLATTGPASDGEVEDYKVTIRCLSGDCGTTIVTKN